MEKEKIIMILVLFLIIIMGCYNYIDNENRYQEININNIQLKVPYNNESILNNNSEHLSIYEDTKNAIKIYVFDTKGTLFTDSKEMFQFITARDTNQLESIEMIEDERSFNYSKSLNEYTYLNQYGSKYILIITQNKEDMIKIIESIRSNTTDEEYTTNYEEKILEDAINYNHTF